MQKSYFNHAFIVDALSTANQFSLTTQKADIDIISIVDNVENTKNKLSEAFQKV